MHQIAEPGAQSNQRIALLALGFRPFFLLAGLSGVLLVGYWVIAFIKGWSTSPHFPSVYWHSHEMIFGYSAAVIAGFLLTAVRNWTDVATVNGKWLLLLALVWLAARILPLTTIGLAWFSLVDMLFLPLLAFAIACPLIKVKQKQNFMFIALLLIYAVANGLFHAEVLLNYPGGEEAGIHGGLAVIIMIITVMAGRVVGFFIERGLDSKVSSYAWAEQLAIWGTALFMISQFFQFKTGLTVIIIIAAMGHLARLVGWYHREIWRVPLLWVLYMGYVWLFAGFVLTVLELHGIVAETLAIHTFTVGTIGVMTVGMMARVALGHTGREMKTHPAMTISFIVINLAVVTRVAFPLMFPEQYLRWVQISGWMWVLAFVIFCLIYAPILIKPRVDGRPG